MPQNWHFIYLFWNANFDVFCEQSIVKELNFI